MRKITIVLAVLGVATAAIAQRGYVSDGSANNIRGAYRRDDSTGIYTVNCCADSKGTDAGFFPSRSECVQVQCADMWTAACRTACIAAWRAANTD